MHTFNGGSAPRHIGECSSGRANAIGRVTLFAFAIILWLASAGIASANVWLSTYNFALADRPSVQIWTDETLTSPYRLRAKFIDGSQYGFHAATAYNNYGAALDALPAPGTYSVALYSVQYASDGITVLAIGPETNVDVTVLWGTPSYQPMYWNDRGTIEHNNNCYNYANNKRTDTYAQPGWWAYLNNSSLLYYANFMYYGCADHGGSWSVDNDGLVRDNLVLAVLADGFEATTASATSPTGKTKMALVMKPVDYYNFTSSTWDYHWYRQDSNGLWSQKHGGIDATDLDDYFNVITNPETADSSYYGYTTFIGYFFTPSDKVQGQGHATIDGPYPE